MSIRKIEPSANQVWWGYQPENEERNAVGVSKTETYDAALFIAPGNSIIMGKPLKLSASIYATKYIQIM